LFLFTGFSAVAVFSSMSSVSNDPDPQALMASNKADK
jgi:hypothetical protein